MVDQKTFNEVIQKKIKEIQDLFITKQTQYADQDPLANFTRGAKLRYGEESMDARFEALKDYVGKHIAHVYNNNLHGAKVGESIGDIAVYFIIAWAMYELRDLEKETNLHIPLNELKNHIDEKVLVAFPDGRVEMFCVIEHDGLITLNRGNIYMNVPYLKSLNLEIIQINENTILCGKGN
ncbi:MAG: hypothetical protein MJ170_02830 [Alphaproteobacteria bacterium]|nr:hypothetical protein [Alphaproteobacteria bacterium]